MNAQQILALYDKEQRREVEFPNTQRETTPNVVRFIPTTEFETGFVLYSRLDAGNVDTVIAGEIARFQEAGSDFEWKYFTHDTPPDLKDRLAAAGFEIDEAEAIMALDIEAAPSILKQPVTHDIRQISTVDKLDEAMAVQREVWDSDFADLTQRLAFDLTHAPNLLKIYTAYVDSTPVSSAWIYFYPGSQFAGLWGGSTLAAYRKQGIYTAMLATRLQVAQKFGARFLTVDASPMSRPILERVGFSLLTMSYPCVWKKSNQT